MTMVRNATHFAPFVGGDAGRLADFRIPAHGRPLARFLLLP